MLAERRRSGVDVRRPGGGRGWSRAGRVAFLALLFGGLLGASGCGSCSGGSGGNHAQCNANEDCPEGSFCDTLSTGRCQPLACDAHRDCPDQWLCSDQGECYDPTGGNQTDCVPLHPGCQCAQSELGMTIDCTTYAQPEGVDKSCHTGKSTCDGERYGTCEDTYLENCDSIHVGAGEFHPTEENSDNVKLGVEGELQLDPDERQVDFGFLWIANTGESTVSKIDIDTGREVARYASALPVPGVPQGVIPYPGEQPWGDCLHCPSRTAIDFNGDAFVANRAFGLQGSVTKFANDVADCVDRDGNGAIDTSWDANDDGVIDPNDPNEFLGQDDECILWTTPVGSVDGKPRALAIDSGSIPDFGPNGNVWVGVYEDGQAHMLRGDTGEDVAVVDLRDGSGNEVHPYGAAVDALGYAWFTGIEDGFVAQVDTIGQNLVGLLDKTAGTGCASAYGIAFDVKGRLWLAGFDCNTAVRYDPTDGSWATIDFSGSGRGPHTRGIAPDLAGTVWVAHTEGWVTRFDAETMQEIEAFQLPHHLGPSEQVTDTVGVGIDRNGACWAVSINQGYTNGTATRIQPGAGMDSFPVGLMPYTYSDFTGFGLTTVTRPTGWYNLVVAGCEDNDPAPPDIVTDWQTLSWNEAEPPGTNVRLRFKVADTLADLDAADWWGPYDDSPVDLDALGVPGSSYMLVQILLSATDPNETPSFLGLSLGFDCGGGGGPG